MGAIGEAAVQGIAPVHTFSVEGTVRTSLVGTAGVAVAPYVKPVPDAHVVDPYTVRL